MARSIVIVMLGLLGLGACSGDSRLPSEPGLPDPAVSQAALVVQVATTGLAPGVDNYLVSVDDGDNKPILVNGGLRIPVSDGTHRLRLSQLPRHCRVASNNPFSGGLDWAVSRDVRVSGADSIVGFSVICLQVGAIRIEVSTAGPHDNTLYFGFLSKHPKSCLICPSMGLFESITSRWGPIASAWGPVGPAGPLRRRIRLT